MYIAVRYKDDLPGLLETYEVSEVLADQEKSVIRLRGSHIPNRSRCIYMSDVENLHIAENKQNEWNFLENN